MGKGIIHLFLYTASTPAIVAVIMLALMAILLRAAVEMILRRILFWVPGENDPDIHDLPVQHA